MTINTYNPPPLTDDELLNLLQNNPEDGLSVAIDRYGGLVKHICANVLSGRSQDIEECTADVFVALWSLPEGFQSHRGNLKGYLCGIARHKAIDRLRQAGRHVGPLPLDETDLGIDVDFTTDIARRINADILVETLDALPSPDREIFIHRYYYYEKIKDIAARLSLSEKAVENRLARGKAAIGKQLLERGIIR